jgi:nucleotide-binding universal stress UspA family protein
MAAIKTILVPTDFSEAAREALRYACMLADVSGASLEVFHAVETPYLTGGYMEVYVAPPDLFEKVEAAARTELEKWLPAEQITKYRVKFVLRIGSPAQEVLSYLRERPDIDLVVMATHGRGAVTRLMMGSVTDKVVRSAPCPVVTIRDLEASRARLTNRAA